MTINSIKVYTDGSFNREIPDLCRGGYVIVINDVIVAELGQVTSHNACYTDRWNVGGEIIAAIVGITRANMYRTDFISRLANENDVTNEIEIYHDYEGLNNWVRSNPKTGKKWKSNNVASKVYVEAIEAIEKQGVNLSFHWVKGHSGDEYNEVADMLAKGEWPFGTKYNDSAKECYEL